MMTDEELATIFVHDIRVRDAVRLIHERLRGKAVSTQTAWWRSFIKSVKVHWDSGEL